MKTMSVLLVSDIGDMGILKMVLCHRAKHTHLAQESEKLKEDLGRAKVEQLM